MTQSMVMGILVFERSLGRTAQASMGFLARNARRRAKRACASRFEVVHIPIFPGNVRHLELITNVIRLRPSNEPLTIP